MVRKLVRIDLLSVIRKIILNTGSFLETEL